jgi:glyoxylase-like metal-dependent hydrolase (beta-lactamase superfamily II)
MRFLLKLIGFLLVAGLILAASALAWGHIQIRRFNPPLPALSEVLEPDRELELPVRLTWINTASQRMPRSAVLEPNVDPDPDAPYVMSHPSFVVEWQDGRIFLVDMGMDAGAAVSFGMLNELLAGAEPIEPHTAASSRLGSSLPRVSGVGFTHMHQDHTAGLLQLCKDIMPLGPGREPVAVFQHSNQISQVNHTTRPAKQHIEEADCIERRTLGFESGLLPIPDFPGLYAIPASGHTPGSTIYVVQLRTFPGQSEGHHSDVETWVITGDIVNHEQGVLLGLPKPRIYSLLVVPENDDRLGKLRDFLKQLAGKRGVKLLVPHDRNQLEKSGLPVYE